MSLIKGQFRSAVFSNLVSKRYKDKLENKAKELGASNTDELKEKLKSQIEKTKKEMNSIDPLVELEKFEQEQVKKAAEARMKAKKGMGPVDPSTPVSPYKTLDSFVKLDKLQELGSKELEFIWRARFQSKENTLSALVPAEVFDKLYVNARKNPTFVLPLPKEEAEIDLPEAEGVPMEMHFVQWNFVGPETTHVLITSLAEYKLHKEYARPHTTIMFHQELSKNKGVVMMNGQVEEQAPVTLAESQLLLLNLQRFYGGLGDGTSEISQRRLKLLGAFNHGSSIFSMDELIELSQSLEN
ncbi:hypothetical protein CANARDRAFT_177844 [[Candida] arabinofermentans NRRL YB-2248]|uniref:Uncharacterized protein n=1 Tax=[Candida] arabinofermentans NRRL YB-2248 TaxID=983967 RepID=A0A1E4SUM1_9ASCO|nr:hypothetical protein CANARDRAFT_177844 [[Candida] arabinofermentans NRRL YB-2248]